MVLVVKKITVLRFEMFNFCIVRQELLSMVKKHSNLIGKTIVDEQDSTDVEVDSGFWHDVFDLYFIRSKESRGLQDDDLLFFVRKMVRH